MKRILERKRSHIELCVGSDVEGHAPTLLDEVQLFHEALPELALEDVDLSTEILGRRLRAPVLIAGMSGGTSDARDLNLALARAAAELGMGMGVGSQRPMLVDPDAVETYRVREVAPEILLLANIGAVQARHAGVRRVAGLVRAIEADGLCVHLNVAQELVQDEGDRDFRGTLETISELVAELPVPVIVKETGCGLSPRALDRLAAVGVEWVDVSGRGGTTWPGVEALRGSMRQRALGTALREWGIPTAASVVYASRRGFCTIASGGIRTALDTAGALALGAEAVSLALPFLRAYAKDGVSGVLHAGAALIEGLSAVMLLTGCKDVAELHDVPRVIGPALRAWIDSDGAVVKRGGRRRLAAGPRAVPLRSPAGSS